MPIPTTTSPLKRPTAGGHFRRLLASLRPPASAGPLPVQTGFPTSLADLVVKNHGRLKKPARKRHHRSPPAPPPSAAAEPAPQPPQRRELSAAHDAAGAPTPPRREGCVRPELLAVVGVMALALLVIWSKRLVAAATVASVALFWIESFSVRAPAARRWRPMPVKREKEEVDSRGRGRGLVSSIREVAESPTETPRPSCAASETAGLAVAGDDSDSISPNKRNDKRRSLRKLLAKKLQSGKRPKEDTDSRHGGDSERPGVGGEASAPAEETAPPQETVVTDVRRHRRRGGALPPATFVPIVLIGLVAGMLPAVALTVLCAVFFTSVERAPHDVSVAQASGHGSDPR